jgi:hypothetical protein
LLLVWQLFVFFFYSSSHHHHRCRHHHLSVNPSYGAIFLSIENVCWYTYSSLIYFIDLLIIVESLMQVHYAIGDLHVYVAVWLLCKQRIRNR